MNDINDRPTIGELLRSVRAPKIELPPFDTEAAPPDPLDLFASWLADAVDAGVLQPNAMVLTTASVTGMPSARTVLLKDVVDGGFWFASLDSGPKGADLATNPWAALTFFWPGRGRQVRVVGEVTTAERDVAERDFRARHPLARAQAIAGDQSAPLPGDAQELVLQQVERLEREPEFVPDDWAAYKVTPHTMEFWAAAPGHEQVRVGYTRGDDGWRHERLWP